MENLDVELELDILGAIYFDYEECAFQEIDIKAEYFSVKKHGEIFTLIMSEYIKGNQINDNTLKDFDIADLMRASTSFNFKEDCRTLKKRFFKRQVYRGIYHLNDILKDSKDPVKDVDKFMTFLAKKSEITTESPIVSRDVYIKEIMDSYQNQKPTAFRFLRLNSQIKIFSPGDLMVIGAGAGVGKTGFSYQLADSIAFMNGEKAAFISMEMTTKGLFLRLASIYYHSRPETKGYTAAQVFDELVKNAGDPRYYDKILSKNMVNVNPGSIRMAQCESLIRQLVKKHGCNTIVIDFLQLMPNNEGKNDYETVSDNIRRFKQLAITPGMECRMIVLSQLNNEKGKDGTVRVTLDSFKSSGAIKDASDYAIGLWKKLDSKGDVLKINGAVLKNRNEGMEQDFVLFPFGTYYTQED